MFTNFSMEISSCPQLASTEVMDDSISFWGKYKKKPRRMQYTFAMDITCKLGYAKEGHSNFEYFMMIFPFDQSAPDQFFCIEDSWDRWFDEQKDTYLQNPIVKNSAGFYEINLCFHWKEELQELVRQRRLGKQMMFAFGCRVVIDEDKKEYWPLVRDGQRRYVAYYGPLIFENKTNSDIDFWRHYNEKYIEKRTVGTREEIVKKVLNHYNDRI